jgi:hypothetical protein
MNRENMYKVVHAIALLKIVLPATDIHTYEGGELARLVDKLSEYKRKVHSKGLTED